MLRSLYTPQRRARTGAGFFKACRPKLARWIALRAARGLPDLGDDVFDGLGLSRVAAESAVNDLDIA
jgi:hypothetical protein